MKHYIRNLAVFEQLHKIPDEMKAYDQWIVWRYEQSTKGKPTKVPYSVKTCRKASVTDPAAWSTFDDMFQALQTGNWAGAGFVFSTNDPFCGIDLDVSEGGRATDIQQFTITKLASYAELSPSGRGAHIIVRGEVPKGRNNQELGIEVYSSGRFFTMTGNAINTLNIEPRQSILKELWEEIGGVFDGDETIHEIVNPTAIDDATLIERICGSGRNKAYFEWTAAFNWSEAYRSVLGAACLFSSDSTQIMRVIMGSGLVRRAPAHGNEARSRRVTRLWATEYNYASRQGDFERGDAGYRIWSTQHFKGGTRDQYNETMLRVADSVGYIIKEFNEKFIVQAHEGAAQARQAIGMVGSGELPVPLRKAGLLTDSDLIGACPVGNFTSILDEIKVRTRNPSHIMATWALLGFVSGSVGRAYVTEDGSGINNFYILAAKSNTGKTQHWSSLMRMIKQTAPNLTASIFGGEASSPQIIAKEAQNKPSMVLRLPDAGTWLQGVISEHNPVQKQLSSALLNIYESAGDGEAWHIPKSIRAKEDKNDTIDEFNMSIVMDTTPQYLTEFDLSHFTSGLLSRFLIVHGDERIADLQKPNKGAYPQEFRTLFETMFTIYNQHSRPTTTGDAGSMGVPNRVVVGYDDSIAEYMWGIEQEINSIAQQIHDGKRPEHHTTSSRVVLNAKRIAATVAIIERPTAPIITKEIYDWSLRFTMSSVTSIIRMFDSGEMGSLEGKQERSIIDFIEKSIVKHPNKPWVTLSELGGYVDKLSPFTSGKWDKPSEARNRKLKDMYERGILIRMERVINNRTVKVIAFGEVQSYDDFE